ncbi:hypothetical protein TGFOU_314800 [Toxoplasma gondii FOU]|uniref:At2g23090-like zinc-binding domain-containing protein n=1 Tax=Toxoplasma gondii FOU TaxID=943167 RepID=A0A086LI06_TOXGO|nr:hypothetical protein TGFOU_314800 [Toxoplasma gondii FOU]
MECNLSLKKAGKGEEEPSSEPSSLDCFKRRSAWRDRVAKAFRKTGSFVPLSQVFMQDRSPFLSVLRSPTRKTNHLLAIINLSSKHTIAGLFGSQFHFSSAFFRASLLSLTSLSANQSTEKTREKRDFRRPPPCFSDPEYVRAVTFSILLQRAQEDGKGKQCVPLRQVNVSFACEAVANSTHKKNTARARADEAKSKEPKSQLKSNQAAMSIKCKVCMQPFMKTQSVAQLNEHAANKHNKTVAECFPEMAS